MSINLLLLLPLIGGCIWYAIRRGVLLGALRAATLTLLTLALLNPKFSESASPKNIAILIDSSSSIPDGLIEKAQQKIAALDLQETSTRYFGKSISTSQSSVDASGTNIADALNESSKLAGSVILISDGFETAGSALTQIQKSKIPVFPIIPEGISQFPENFTVSQFDLPLRAKEGKGAAIRIVASNGTSEAKQGALEISQDGELLHQEALSLDPKTDAVIRASAKPLSNDTSVIKAVLREAGNVVYEEEKIIHRAKEARMLLVENSPEESKLIAQLPINTVIDRVSPQSLTKDQIQNAPAIILNNVKASEVTPTHLSEIKEKVRSGGSLLMVGGNKSFGLGEYIGSAIEEVLPVKLIPPQKEEKRLNVAVQLVLDKSKSMADDQRLQQAKEAAVQVIRNLKDDDFVGVIGFDRVQFPVIPITQLKDNRDRMADTLLRLLRPWGTTQLLPALSAAKDSLESVNAGRKHVIVLTDGELNLDSRITLIEMVKMMRFSGITVSTVLIGPDFDTPLRQMAEVGGGAYYNTPDPSILPRIFLRDIFVRAGERNLKESQEYSVYSGSAPLITTSLREFPHLLGFTKTETKDAAQTELLVGTPEEKSPLLASKKYEKGNAVAFTSDFAGRWTKPWAESQKTTLFFDELIRSLKPDAGLFDFESSYAVDGENLRLEVIITSGESPKNISAQITLPSEKTISTELVQVAHGRFETTISDITEGAYTVTFTPPGDSISFSLSKDLFGERKGKGIKVGFLEKLANFSGGKVNPTKDEITTAIGLSESFKTFRYEFLWGALLFWIVEIYLRERPKKRALKRKGA